MCSMQEELTAFEEKSSKSSVTCTKCRKCEEPAAAIIHGNDSMCRSCFDGYCVHKFRSSFGKHHIIRDGEPVLVAYSGGASSCAMVQLVNGGLSKRAQKKLRFVPTLCHIDETAALGYDIGKRVNVISDIIAMMKDTEIPFKLYLQEQVYALDIVPIVEFPAGGDDDLPTTDELQNRIMAQSGHVEKLTAAIKQSKSLDVKIGLLRLLRSDLLQRVTNDRVYNKILLGDSSTRLAIRLISDLTQGRGAHLPYIMNFADTRNEKTTFVRPMRELSAREIAMYNCFNKVPTYFIPNFLTKAPLSSSLELTSEHFALRMQNQNCSALPKIFRTGEKFDLDGKMRLQKSYCVLCHAPLDTDKGVGSTLEALEFSRKIPLQNKQQLPTTVNHVTQTANQLGALSTDDTCCKKDSTSADPCCQSSEGCCSSKTKEGDALTLAELTETLCYGCRIVASEMTTADHLPPVMYNDALTITNRKKQREVIADYLLSDSGDD